ncbi:methyltransferase-like protein 7A isoform X2 [Folsomia candida]|nr:methyltransferase-like protein 7A isoform X2 [Folsomia candida]
MMKEFAEVHEQLLSDIKDALFDDLRQIESKVVDLRNKGVIRILEIGVGAGTNLKYYPQQCRLVLVDPNFYFKLYFDENKSKFPDINLEKFIVSSGENLKGVASNSVDVVVTTTVLCSVENVKSVLREIRRVLVPGGRYYFMEHLLDEYVPHRTQLQKALTWSRIWPWLCDGCKFLPIRSEISLCGFSTVDYREFMLDNSNLKGKVKLLATLMAPHIVGIAKK